MKYTRLLLPLITIVFISSLSCSAQNPSKTVTDKKYDSIQVNRFEVTPGVDFPPDYRLTIDEDLNKVLGSTKGVKHVLREGETIPEGARLLSITGIITKYSKGNQAARYLVGFGAGATVIGAHIKCFDAATTELLFEADVDGKVVMGMMGGKSEGANNGLAKEIAKDVKKKFF